MISGVHFNFSFSDYLIDKLFENNIEDISYKEFKNRIYLKISRNYIRYCWLIIYLTGSSIGFHKTYDRTTFDDIYPAYGDVFIKTYTKKYWKNYDKL